MKTRINTYILIAFFCVATFYAFDQKEEEEVTSSQKAIPPLVQIELDKKLKKYQKTILDKCKKKALEDAEFYIDSLVSEELKLQASDTLKFPAKPIRPQLREPIILNDSTPIAPIIKN